MTTARERQGEHEEERKIEVDSEEPDQLSVVKEDFQDLNQSKDVN